MKILFAGNSITLHGFAPQIGWTGNYGMAATCERNDYVHVLCRMLGNDAVPMIRNIADFERDPAGTALESYADMRDFRADVIVLRICENTPSDKVAEFGAAYERLINYLRADETQRVLCVGSFWRDDAKEAEIMSAAAKTGSLYVPLTELYDERYQARGSFGCEGVAAHPSDAGMKAIAEIIYAAIK